MSAAGLELDCRGQRCPLPVIALARRLADVAVWCRMRGQTLLRSDPPAFEVRREH